MGGCLSCLLDRFSARDAPNGDLRSEERLPVGDSRRSGIFVNSETAQDATPLLKTSEMKMVMISDSSSGSFDQEMIDKLLKEVEGSEDSA